jgi:DMSO reductase anchor subunit
MEVQWPLVFFTLLTGLGVGAFAFVAIAEWLGKAERTRLLGAITAIVAMAAGGIASIFHLGHIERIFNVLGNFGSGLYQEMILMGLTGLAVLIYIIMLRKGSSAGARKAIALIGLVLAIMLSVAMGTSYVLTARPAWNTFLLPIVYVASAAVLGIFSMYVWASRKEEKSTVTGVNKTTLIALIVQVVLVAGYIVFLAVAPYADPARSPARLLAGDISVIFWLGIVMIGLVIPLWLTAFHTARRILTPFTLAVVGLGCVLVGGIAFRVLMYILGSSIEQFL